MAELAFGIAGAAVAGIPGLGVTALSGFAIGSALGSFLYPPTLPGVDRGRIADIRVNSASPGVTIPQVWGRYRVPGTILWTGGLTESVSSSNVGGGPSGGGSQIKDYSYSVNLAVMACAGPINSIRKIWADSELIYDGSDWIESIDPDKVTFYLGNEAQTADPVMVAALGASDTPAYRGRAYVVFEDLQLAKWGNRIPNLSFEVQSGATDHEQLDDVLTDLVELVEVDPADCDFSDLAAVNVYGFAINQRGSLSGMLDTLQFAYLFDLVEVDGALASVRRGGSVSKTLTEAQLGALAGNMGAAEPVSLVRTQDLDLPRRVDVKYLSPSIDYQTSTQSGQRLVGLSEDVQTIDLPLVLSDDYAREIAELATFLPWVERTRGTVTVPPTLLDIAPADLLAVPTDAGLLTMRVVGIRAGLVGHLGLSLVEDDPTIYTQSLTGGASPGESGTLSPAVDSVLEMLDTNAVRDADADEIGFYYAVTSTQEGYPGSLVSLEQGGGPILAIRDASGHVWSNLPTGGSGSGFSGPNVIHTERATLGLSLDALPSGPTTVFDNTNTVDVLLTRNALADATELEVLNGTNLALLGEEVIGFTTATLVAANTYRLSGLLRGRRGTEYAIGAHAIGDEFILLDSLARRFDAKLSENGRSFNFRAIVAGRVYSTLPDQVPLTLSGNSRKPYSPVHVTGTRDGSNNLTLDWVRRVRKGGELVDYTDAPLDETSEAYEVEIYSDGTYSVLKRTITGLGTPTAGYTAAQQVTDFGSVQNPVYLRIYQISDVIGRGHPFEGSV